MYEFYMQQDILHVFIEPVVLYIMYKTEIIYKITFYMKLMTASCSMSKFLPIVIIFRQILTSQFTFSCIYHLTCSNMSLYMFVCLTCLTCLSFSYHVIHIYTSCYFPIIYIFLSRICNHFILF